MIHTAAFGQAINFFHCKVAFPIKVRLINGYGFPADYIIFSRMVSSYLGFITCKWLITDFALIITFGFIIHFKTGKWKFQKMENRTFEWKLDSFLMEVLNQFVIVIHGYILQIDFFHRKLTFILQIGLNVISAFQCNDKFDCSSLWPKRILNLHFSSDSINQAIFLSMFLMKCHQQTDVMWILKVILFILFLATCIIAYLICIHILNGIRMWRKKIHGHMKFLLEFLK